MNRPTTWLGLALLVVGVVWILQGTGVAGGSMSGKTVWAVIGAVLAIGGAGLLATNVRGRGTR